MDDSYSRYVQDGDLLPVFPLPDFVLFPYVSAPLHIFEPRYRQMMDTILDSRGVFCMAVLRNPGSKPQLKAPEFWGVGCVCRLVDYDQLPDGRFNILVDGLVRVRLQEVASQQLYRRVRVNLDPVPAIPAATPDQEKRLRRIMEQVLKATPDISPGLAKTLHEIELKGLLNVMAFHCPAPAESKLKLLYADSQQQMCERVIELYDTIRF